MAQTGTFHCSVITPERTVLDTEATFAALPAHDGELGILTNRAPLVCRLGIGVLRVEADRIRHSFFLDGGFAQMVSNRLTILTQQARSAKEIDPAAAEKSLADARAMTISGDKGFDTRQSAIRRAQTQLAVVRQAKN
jgi:F-type H+-transporting ATPase subunit epsilon